MDGFKANCDSMSNLYWLQTTLGIARDFIWKLAHILILQCGKKADVMKALRYVHVTWPNSDDPIQCILEQIADQVKIVTIHGRKKIKSIS